MIWFCMIAMAFILFMIFLYHSKKKENIEVGEENRFRNRDFERMEGLPVWYDEIMYSFEAAFLVHYEILDNMIAAWREEVVANNDAARTTYFVNTVYMSTVLTEMLLVVELLMKAELSRAEVKPPRVHKLKDLMDLMKKTNDSRCIKIEKCFEQFMEFLCDTDKRNAFVNARYIDYSLYSMDNDCCTMIRLIISVIDDVYEEFYSDIDITKLLYLGMDCDEAIDELTEDEKKRLKKAGVLPQKDL